MPSISRYLRTQIIYSAFYLAIGILFTQQYAFYLESGILLSNRHFTWNFTRQFLKQVQSSRHVPDTIKY